MLTRVLETVAPTRLGRSFRLLLSSDVVNNLADGIVLAAGPLLVASQTRDPLLVSMALLLQRLPFLLFGFLAGAIADRLDRRRIVVLVDLLRAGVLATLATTIVTGTVSIWVVLTAMFVLGTAETFADTAARTLLPSIVDRMDLGIGNARLQSSYLLANQMAGPPIGALLFAAGAAWPFVVNAVCFALGALLVVRITLSRAADTRSGSAPGAPPSTIRRDIAEGVRWLWHHPPVRTLALTIVAFNVTYGAAWAVLVLYADQQLGMGAVGFGLLSTALAVGGLIGTASYGWLERRVSLADLMRAGLVIETLTHLALALTTEPWVAMVVMVVFGAHAFVWGTTSTTVRQRSVPDRLLGRVTSVYMIGLVGGLVLGTPLGGLLARSWGITAPFWFGFAGSAVLVVVLWRELAHIVHVSEAPPAD